MPKTFEMLRYVEHLRRRWRVIGGACGVAAVLALTVALLTPVRFTATTRIMIEPPAGSDSHFAVAVNPIYLESLKTYELVASGDRLFLDAADHFKIPHPRSAEALKRSVLKVSIPRNTRILEIAVTLHDPVQAQALALYIAQQTVKVTHDLSHALENEVVADAQKHLGEARGRMEQAERAWAALSKQPAGWTADRAVQVRTAQAERNAAHASFDAAEKQLDETRSVSGERGENLKIVDPGVVPERPSSPNVPLTLFSALLVALVGSLFYATLEFNYGLEKSSSPRSLAPVARVKTGND